MVLLQSWQTKQLEIRKCRAMPIMQIYFQCYPYFLKISKQSAGSTVIVFAGCAKIPQPLYSNKGKYDPNTFTLRVSLINGSLQKKKLIP